MYKSSSISVYTPQRALDKWLQQQNNKNKRSSLLEVYSCVQVSIYITRERERKWAQKVIIKRLGLNIYMCVCVPLFNFAASWLDYNVLEFYLALKIDKKST